MTEVKETDREAVKADLLQRIKSEPQDAQRVVQLKKEIAQRETLARRLNRLNRDPQWEETILRVDQEGAEDSIDLSGATEVRFTQTVRGKDGSVAEEGRVAFISRMENNKPVWVAGKDGSPLSFSAALLDKSPESSAVARRIDSGLTRAYPLLDKINGSIRGVRRVTMPRGPVGK